MVDFLWKAPDTIADAIAAANLSALADGSAISLANCTEINNESGLFTHCLVELNINSTVNVASAAAFVAVYCVPAVDGTNYPEMTATTNVPPATFLACWLPFVVRNNIQRQASLWFPIPPVKFKLPVQNRLGVAFPTTSTNITFKYRRANLKTA